MIALLWLLVWELSLLPPVQDALPDRAVGLLYLALIVVGLGVGWYGVVGREINRVAWIITIGGFLASTSRYLGEVGQYAAALGQPMQDALMLFLWLGIPLAWAAHPLLAGAEWAIGKARNGQGQGRERRTRRRRLRYRRR